MAADAPVEGGEPSAVGPTSVSAEIVAVGSELLLGDTVDTNSAWISARLAEIGVDVYRHSAVGDNVSRLAAALTEACARAAVVIVTGGLGPTADDLTRVAVAEIAGVALERRPELVSYLEDYFARGGREMPAGNLIQADLPAGARVLAPVGSAAGFAVTVARSTVWCLPGVPSEMRRMVLRDVVPALAALAGAKTTISRVIRTAGISESAVDEALASVVRRLEEAGNPTLAFLASGGETRVRLTAKAASRAEALALLDPPVSEVLERLGANVTGVDGEGVEAALARQLRRLGLTLATGESVTGGAVSSRLVSVPGASDWFRGGVVTYATDAKTSLAGVDADLLERDGPVSEAVAAALARGARDRLGADIGLAVVGVAGPDPQGGQSLGTVWVAAALPDGSAPTLLRRLPGRGRSEVQVFAASSALDFLRRLLAEF